MAHLSESIVTLRVIGDDLDPEEITRILGHSPTTSHRKGEAIRGYVKKTGMWRLEATVCKPENLDGQVAELLGKVTQDLDVWAGLRERFYIDLFCGLFMEQGNEGAEVSSDTLCALGERGIRLSLDLYGPIETPQAGGPTADSSGTTEGHGGGA